MWQEWTILSCSWFKWKSSQSFTIKCLTSCFSWMPFILGIKFPSIPSLCKVFIMKECWILSKAFLILLIWLNGFYYYINIVYYINWFLDVKLTLHSWNKTYLGMVYNTFYILLDWFAGIVLSIESIISKYKLNRYALKYGGFAKISSILIAKYRA